MGKVIVQKPAKQLTTLEQSFLRIAGEELAKVKFGGPAALACLLDIVASWHGNALHLGFHDYGKRWLLEGGAGSKVADTLLRDLFGLNEPGPNRAA